MPLLTIWGVVRPVKHGWLAAAAAAAAATAAVLSACTPLGPVSKEILTSGLEPGRRKSLCVLSAVGDKFGVQTIGFTVFGNEFAEVAIDAWRIDEHVTSKVSALLGQRFDVKRLATDKDAFTSLQQHGGIFLTNEAPAKAALRKAAGTQKCDLYLAVAKTGHPVSGTNQGCYGLGILRFGTGRAVFSKRVHLHTLGTLTIYDGSNFAALSHQRLSIGQSLFGNIMTGPHQGVDESWWPSPPQAAVNPKMREAVVALLDQSLAMTLAEMLPAY